MDALIENVVLEHTSYSTWAVIVTCPYLNVPSPIHDSHGLDLTHVNMRCCNDHTCQWKVCSKSSNHGGDESKHDMEMRSRTCELQHCSHVLKRC